VADLLRPGIMLRAGYGEWPRQRDVGHDFLGRYVKDAPALLIDRRDACAPLVQAFAGGCRYPWVHGEPATEPEDNDAYALVRAVLGVLAQPAVTMREAEYRKIMGPKTLAPW
jgi:hypothetical protein